ncbi:hypothetical protein B0T14DRAFT_569673 [Immersiella caudata]|uniref:Uncharacterized protein n=1 Tax=Immersiella caudata TaxID=314043 RepID=A0AA39WE05_9PEZI|nr:hypothetical protein B0T14DRAFT_569673 [Immersiella caudata]
MATHAREAESRSPPQIGSSSSTRAPDTALPSTPRLPRFRVIQYLHQHGHSALERISNYDGGRILDPVVERLGRWGEPFQGPLALDLLVATRDAKENKLLYGDLREVLISSLVDIILIEESILSELVKDPSRRDLEQVLLSVVSSLAVEDATDIAANQPTVVLPFESGTEELLKSGQRELESVVNGLHELLPTIRMIRRGAMLDLEAQQQRRPQTELAQATATQAAETEAMSTEELLDTVIDAVSPRATEDTTQSRGTSPRAPMRRKEVELLQEYKALHAAKLLGEDKEITDRMLREFLLVGEKPGGQIKVDGLTEKGRLELQRRAENLVNDLPRPAQR